MGVTIVRVEGVVGTEEVVDIITMEEGVDTTTSQTGGTEAECCVCAHTECCVCVSIQRKLV